MTGYRNFTQDFPERCWEILETYEPRARSNDLEVTLLPAVMAAAFVIPYGRLRPSNDAHIASDRYPTAVYRLGQFEESEYASLRTVRSWRYAREEMSRIQGKVPDFRVPSLDIEPFKPNTKTVVVLLILRNALAHGNIATIPSRASALGSPQIREPVFVSEHRIDGNDTGWRNILSVTPGDLRTVLRKWIEFLQSPPMRSPLLDS